MDNIIENKSFEFAVRIVKLYQHLTENKKEFVMSKQLLRSGTSIGANVSEAQKGQSKADFNMKMNIALKEANESDYWLRLLYRTDYLTKQEFESIQKDAKEIIAILVSICKKNKPIILHFALCILYIFLPQKRYINFPPKPKMPEKYDLKK